MISRRTSISASIDRVPSSHSFVRLRQWRRLGLVIWNAWRVHRIGLFEGPLRKSGKVPTPDGGSLPAQPTDEQERAQIPLVDYASRWFALIGEKLPFERRGDIVGNR